MRRALLAAAACLTAASTAAAQRVVIGPQFAFGEYREITSTQRYVATGFGGTLTLAWKKLGADVSFAGLSYEPYDDGLGQQSFKATQLDAHLRYRVWRGASLEAGFVSRTSDNEFAAQSVGSIRLGAHAAVPLGPDAGAMVRYNVLVGSKFSGGGTAGLGMDVGLGVFYGLAKGRVRLTGDYEFERINRTVDPGTGDIDAPIQQILGKVGLAVTF